MAPVLIRTLYSGMLSGKKNILLKFLCQIVSYDTNNVMFIDLTIYYLLVLLVSYLLGNAKFVDSIILCRTHNISLDVGKILWKVCSKNDVSKFSYYFGYYI